MSQTRVKYVEIPKECHVSDSDPLQKCQDLVSSMIELAFENRSRGSIIALHHLEYEEDEEIISDEEVPDAIDSERGELDTLSITGRTILDIVQSVFDRINDAIITNEDDPWARKVSSWRHRSTKELRRSPMRFERPMFRDYVDPNTLSFGQRSAIVLECWLGYMAVMEFTSQPSAMHGSGRGTSPRTCLVLDEPEAGRSEHSVDSLSYRVSEARGLVGSVSDNSLLVMSHRRDVLEAVGDGGRFHLMQQFDDAELGHDSEE